jgi:hypothetical protein
MRSLRLFYSDPECTRGQVVIASRESQYKILHFHTGGLDKLAEIFKDCLCLTNDTLQTFSNVIYTRIHFPTKINMQCNQCLSLTKVVSSNPTHDGLYSIQHYVINFVSDAKVNMNELLSE